jgi:hypothetical protein
MTQEIPGDRPIWYTEIVDGQFVDHRITHYLDVGIDWSRNLSVFIYTLENGRKLQCNIPVEIIRNSGFESIGGISAPSFPYRSIEHYLFANYRITIGEPIHYVDVQKERTITYMANVCQHCNTPVNIGLRSCDKCGAPYKITEENIIINVKEKVVEKPVHTDVLGTVKDFERESTRQVNMPNNDTNEPTLRRKRLPLSWRDRIFNFLWDILNWF